MLHLGFARRFILARRWLCTEPTHALRASAVVALLLLLPPIGAAQTVASGARDPLANTLSAGAAGPSSSSLNTAGDSSRTRLESSQPPEEPAFVPLSPHWTPWLVLIAWVLVGAAVAAALRNAERRSEEHGASPFTEGEALVSENQTTLHVAASDPSRLEPETKASDGIDRTALFDRLEGNADLLRELIVLFTDHGPRLLAEIRGAIADGDVRRLELASHSLRGALSNLAADRAAEVALRLERLAQAGDLTEVTTICTTLEREVAHAQHILTVLQRSPTPFGQNAAAA